MSNLIRYNGDTRDLALTSRQIRQIAELTKYGLVREATLELYAKEVARTTVAEAWQRTGGNLTLEQEELTHHYLEFVDRTVQQTVYQIGEVISRRTR